MQGVLSRLGSLFLLAACLIAPQARTEPLRPPAVPLVACDPYFSIWSPADKLTDSRTVHWTGKPNRLTSLVRIDGKTYRIMGAEPGDLPALNQISLKVLPTRTIYQFSGAGIKLQLTFMTPALPDDLDILSRPVTYLTWGVQSDDNASHTVNLYLEARSEIAVDTAEEAVTFQNADNTDVRAWRVGTVDQAVLRRSGDDVRIDWGYLYLAASRAQDCSITAGTAGVLRRAFASTGRLDAAGTPAQLHNNPHNDGAMALAHGDSVSPGHALSCTAMLMYDDLYSIQYFGKNLRPYWRRNGDDASVLLTKSARDYESLEKRCEAFDDELMADLRQAGGEDYAVLAALAYRQCFAAGKIVADANGQPMQFCKENHSNGCISTSDVFYPMSPQFLLFGPALAKAFIVPFMNYAASDHWKFPFAPHDLGTYPKANGQVYGDGERGVNNQMPVEESGNLLCLFGAVAQMEGNPGFANLYWPQLQRWAQYLREKGFDPERQLCTDDFAGHLAHNVNLSAKAICALGAYGKLCVMRGDTSEGNEYLSLARGFAQRWMKEADDGDHYRLAFDAPGTWSQKYNLVWDRILGLNIFPPSVARKEMDFYKKKQNKYGLPLDNRKTYTKLDWVTWTATLTQDRADFEALVKPIIAFLNATPDRSPMTDWYQTETAHKVGFTARPVVGGVFLQMLYDQTVWNKYAGRNKTVARNWPALPKPPKITVVLPAADRKPALWSYSTAPPSAGWMQPAFNDTTWKRGLSGFGTSNTPGAIVGTQWHTDDIWLRREAEVPAGNLEGVCAWLHHDEDAEIYINGILAVHVHGYTTKYDVFPISEAARTALKPGKNCLAIHCHQTLGGQYVDLGLVRVSENQQ